MHSPSLHRSHSALRQGAGLNFSTSFIISNIEFFFMHQNDSMISGFDYIKKKKVLMGV